MNSNDLIDNTQYNKNNESFENDFERRAETFEMDSKWVKNEEINNTPLEFLSCRRAIDDLLDAGGGTGYLSYFLSIYLPIARIYLVDTSKNMLDIAKQKMEEINVVCSSIESFCLSTDKKFDAVLLRQVLHYVEDVNEVIKLIKSIMRTDGVLYIGQFVIIDNDCREWHNELMQEISKNRRRTFVYAELVECLFKNDLEIIKFHTTDIEENIRDLYKKHTNNCLPYDYMEKMKNRLTDRIIKNMSVRVADDNIYFTHKFHHFLLRNKVSSDTQKL